MKRADIGRSKAVILTGFLGCAALWIFASYPYLPLDNLELSVAGVLPGVVALLLVFRQVISRPPTLKHWIAAAAPWSVAGLILLNGALDRSPDERHATIVQRGYVYRADLRHAIVLRSWRLGRSTESIPYEYLQRFYLDNEPIVVTVRSGALGMPWISRVEP